jgi:hypothetical protein
MPARLDGRKRGLEGVDAASCGLYKTPQLAAGAIPPPLFFERYCRSTNFRCGILDRAPENNQRRSGKPWVIISPTRDRSLPKDI